MDPTEALLPHVSVDADGLLGRNELVNPSSDIRSADDSYEEKNEESSIAVDRLRLNAAMNCRPRQDTVLIEHTTESLNGSTTMFLSGDGTQLLTFHREQRITVQVIKAATQEFESIGEALPLCGLQIVKLGEALKATQFIWTCFTVTNLFKIFDGSAFNQKKLPLGMRGLLKVARKTSGSQHPSSDVYRHSETTVIIDDSLRERTKATTISFRRDGQAHEWRCFIDMDNEKCSDFEGSSAEMVQVMAIVLETFEDAEAHLRTRQKRDEAAVLMEQARRLAFHRNVEEVQSRVDFEAWGQYVIQQSLSTNRSQELVDLVNSILGHGPRAEIITLERLGELLAARLEATRNADTSTAVEDVNRVVEDNSTNRFAERRRKKKTRSKVGRKQQREDDNSSLEHGNRQLQAPETASGSVSGFLATTNQSANNNEAPRLLENKATTSNPQPVNLSNKSSHNSSSSSREHPASVSTKAAYSLPKSSTRQVKSKDKQKLDQPRSKQHIPHQHKSKFTEAFDIDPFQSTTLTPSEKETDKMANKEQSQTAAGSPKLVQSSRSASPHAFLTPTHETSEDDGGDWETVKSRKKRASFGSQTENTSPAHQSPHENQQRRGQTFVRGNLLRSTGNNPYPGAYQKPAGVGSRSGNIRQSNNPRDRLGYVGNNSDNSNISHVGESVEDGFKRTAPAMMAPAIATKSKAEVENPNINVSGLSASTRPPTATGTSPAFNDQEFPILSTLSKDLPTASAADTLSMRRQAKKKAKNAAKNAARKKKNREKIAREPVQNDDDVAFNVAVEESRKKYAAEDEVTKLQAAATKQDDLSDHDITPKASMINIASHAAPLPSSRHQSADTVHTTTSAANLGGETGPKELKFDSYDFTCIKGDCRKVTSPWDGQTVICPRCGPYSITRYCCLQHLLDDVAMHWSEECFKYTIMQPCDAATIDPRQIQGPPAIPNICGWDTVERHRQVIYHAAAYQLGDYFIFTDAEDKINAGSPPEKVWGAYRGQGKLKLVVKFDDDSLKDRFNRLMNVCLLTGLQNSTLVLQLYLMVRDNLVAKGQWSEDIHDALQYQFCAEFRWLFPEYVVGLERHACPFEWRGEPVDLCPDPICNATMLNPRTGVSLFQRVHFERDVEDLERQYWLLRVARVYHPQVVDKARRMTGEGFPGVQPRFQRRFCMGAEWEGFPAGRMEVENAVWVDRPGGPPYLRSAVVPFYPMMG